MQMSKEDFVREHLRLISRLRHPDKESLRDEANKQESEMKEINGAVMMQALKKARKRKTK